MRFQSNRRRLLAGALSFPALHWLGMSGIRDAVAAEAPDLGPPQPFDFDRLREEARLSATRPYLQPTIRFADVLEKIDYDAYQQIRFQPDHALWAESGSFPVQLFHPGRSFKAPVTDRKSVVSGKRVSVRVDPGGSRIITKKKK